MSGKARILFVDDEKRVLNAMRGLFRRHYELYLANSGREAIEMAENNDIDVIVADQRMPGMTGIEVLSAIKKASPRTVRILLTGYADPSAIEGSINQGEVFRFLSKPCPPGMLRETLELAIDASKTEASAVSERTPESAPVAPPPDPSPESTAVRTKRTSQFSETGVVVFTVNSEFAASIVRATSEDRRLEVATTLVKVSRILQQNKAGVLITDFTSNSSILQKVVNALKMRMPELVTIVISEARDSTDMINLINYGQIFRYSVKPVSGRQLREDIDAAAARHIFLKKNPDAVVRHRVELAPEPETDDTTVGQFVREIKKCAANNLAAAVQSFQVKRVQ